MERKKDLGRIEIKKLLYKQSMPAIIGLLVVSFYNLVDTIYIGWGVGTLGIAGVAIAFPIQMILIAIAQSMGIGASSIISRALGSENNLKASNTLGNFFSINFIVGTIFTLLGFIFLKPLLKLFGATDTIMPYAYDYMSIIIFGSIFIIFASASNSIIRSEGKAKYAMMVMIASAITNIILDPIFIFGLNMGIKGAALATIISYLISACAALYFFISKRTEIRLKLINFKIKLKIIFEIFKIGASSFSRMVASSIMAIIVNHSLGFYGGDLAIAAFGIVNRLLMFIIMPMFGVVQGMQPILGYNYGANKIKRVVETIKLSTKSTSIMAIIAFLLILIFAELLIKMFTKDPELISTSTKAIKIIIIMFPVIGFQVITAGMYQAFGYAGKAFFISILRQVIFIIPIIFFLPQFLGLDGVWITFPISDFLAGIVTWFFFNNEIKHLNKKLKNIN